jgi:hypothetical protein
LQVTPSLLPGTDTAVIDLQSTVTGWQQPDQPILLGSSSRPGIKETGEQGVSVQVPGGAGFTTVDRVIMPAQQLATTLRVPLGRPVLVGGLTLNPAESAEGEGSQQERKQLYLIVRTSTCEEDPSRVPEKPATTSR